MHVVKDFPIGRLKIETKDNKVIKIIETSEKVTETEDVLLNKVVSELNEYFSGERIEFSFLVQLSGTEFEKTVLKHLINVRFGETTSYSTLAEAVKSKHYARAVARVVSNNPLLIVVPCHRVIKRDGTIGGFRLSEENKRYLLKLEKEVCINKQNEL